MKIRAKQNRFFPESPAIAGAPFFGLCCSARRVDTTKARIKARKL